MTIDEIENYFRIIKTNNALFYCCNREYKKLVGGEESYFENYPWGNIKNDFTSGKVANCTILKVLDKGIIFDLGEGLEGIVPLKRMKKHEKNQILTNFKEGDTHEVTVQEVDEE